MQLIMPDGSIFPLPITAKISTDKLTVTINSVDYVHATAALGNNFFSAISDKLKTWDSVASIDLTPPPVTNPMTITSVSFGTCNYASQVVTVSGTGFTDAVVAYAGLVQVPALRFISPTSVEITLPVGVNGTAYDLTFFRSANDHAVLAGAFTYNPATITSVDIATGNHVGQVVTVTGTGFVPNITAFIGATPVQAFSFVSSTSAHITLPDGANGTAYDLLFYRSANDSAVLVGAVNYPAVVFTGVSPSPLAAGLVVLTGTGFLCRSAGVQLPTPSAALSSPSTGANWWLTWVSSTEFTLILSAQDMANYSGQSMPLDYTDSDGVYIGSAVTLVFP